MRRSFGFRDGHEYDAFAEAYRALDGYSTDARSYFEISTAVQDGEIETGARMFEDAGRYSLRQGETSSAARAFRLAGQLISVVDDAAALAFLRRATDLDAMCPAAWLQLGRVSARRGELASAEAALRRAADLTRGKGGLTYTSTCWALATLAGKANESDRSLYWNQQALLDSDMQLRLMPRSGPRRMQLAFALEAYALDLARYYTLTKARPFIEQATALWRDLEADAPSRGALRAARLWQRVAEVCVAEEEPEDALLACRQVFAVTEAQASAHPDDARLQSAQATAWLLIAHIESGRGHVADALLASRRAAAMRALVLNRGVSGVLDAGAVGDAEAHVALMHWRRGDIEAARAAYDRAITRWRDMAADDFDDVLLFNFALALVQRAALPLELEASDIQDQSIAMCLEAEKLLLRLEGRGKLDAKGEVLLDTLEAVLAAIPKLPANDA